MLLIAGEPGQYLNRTGEDRPPPSPPRTEPGLDTWGVSRGVEGHMGLVCMAQDVRGTLPGQLSRKINYLRG